jgi:hypothetical protein
MPDFQWTFESRLSLAEQKCFIKMQECDKSEKSLKFLNGNSKQGNGTKVLLIFKINRINIKR